MNIVLVLLLVWMFCRNPDYMLIENQENGNYTAHWVPTVPGVYSVQLHVDGRHTGEFKHIPISIRVHSLGASTIFQLSTKTMISPVVTPVYRHFKM